MNELHVSRSSLGFRRSRTPAVASAALAVACLALSACSEENKPSSTDPQGGKGNPGGDAGAPSTTVEGASLGPTADVAVTGHILKLERLPPPDLEKIRVPDGFVITKAAEGLGNARLLVVGSGGIYVTRRVSTRLARPRSP